MEEAHVTEIGALAELGGTYLEVRGKVVMRNARRLSDLANDEDELLDMEEAEVRVHSSAEDLWDQVPGMSLNRDELLLLIPISETSAGSSDLKAPGRQVRVKLYCGPLEVTGFVTVPIDQTVSGWHRTTRTRFLSLTQARVQPIMDDLKIEGGEGVYKFLLINRRRLTALIEARAKDAAGLAIHEALLSEPVEPAAEEEEAVAEPAEPGPEPARSAAEPAAEASDEVVWPT